MRTGPGNKIVFPEQKDALFDDHGRRHGTSQTTTLGQVKACYSMVFYYNSAVNSILLDRYLAPIILSQNPNSQMTYRGLNDPGGNYDGFTNTMQPTATAVSTQSAGNSYTYPNSVKNCGECGNSAYDIYSNGNYISPVAVGDNKHAVSYQFVDSDHTDRKVMYVYSSGPDQLEAIDRISHLPLIGFTPLQLVSTNGGKTISRPGDGGLSYNRSRKELVAISSGDGLNLSWKIWSNVDFDKYPSPGVALTQPDVTVKSGNVTMTYQIPYTIAYQSLKPVLCDNGDVWFMAQSDSSNVRVYKVTINRTDSSATITYTTNLGVSSLQFGSTYDGVKKMQSRDGSTVALFSQYYYYACGLAIIFIDKTKSTYQASNFATTGNTSASVAPFGDSGWLVAGGSVNGGNPSSFNNNLQLFERVNNGYLGAIAASRRVKLPWLCSIGTTDYPIINQVADYSLLTDQSLN